MEYIMTPQLECLLKVTNTEETRLILVSGPTGCGKNAMLEAWSESTGRSIERVMTSNSVELIRGGLVKDRMAVAIRGDLLDEDIVENLKSFRKRKGIVVFVVDTSDDGFINLPVRVKDIFHYFVEISYLSEGQEAALIAAKTGLSQEHSIGLVYVATSVRRRRLGKDSIFTSQVSTRRLLIAAQNMRLYGVDSLAATLVNLFSPKFSESSYSHSERGHLIEMLKGKFGYLRPKSDSEPEPEPELPTTKKKK
jgi:hypothetical protein